MDGILLINKESGWTSRDVVNKVGHIFGTKKVGHAGTLDPMATGVLVVCIGKYTKLVDILTGHEKEYVATMRLGIKTDTGDITGHILEENDSVVSDEMIQKSFTSFPRKYMQKVPLYSAVKINGKKLYEYARENISVELPTREVVLSDLNLLNIENKEITFSTCVSKGTYIRSLIEDIAATFGTVATMCSLVRTKSGNFKLNDCVELKNVTQDTSLLHIEDLFFYPKIEIDEIVNNMVKNGNKLILDSVEERVLLVYRSCVVAIYEKENQEYKLVFKVI